MPAQSSVVLGERRLHSVPARLLDWLLGMTPLGMSSVAEAVQSSGDTSETAWQYP